MVAAAADSVPIRFAGDAYEAGTTSHDAFDALICALVARAVTERPTRPARSGAEIRRAATEGWVHVPKKTAGRPDRVLTLLGRRFISPCSPAPRAGPNR